MVFQAGSSIALVGLIFCGSIAMADTLPTHRIPAALAVEAASETVGRDKNTKQKTDQKQGAEHSRHTEALQHPQGGIQEKHENEGKDDRKDDLARHIESAEECQYE
jgi:hypothetical protein